MTDLIQRLEGLSGPDREMDALIHAAVYVPGGDVEQSPINGVWCIYVIGYGGKRRLWEARRGEPRSQPYTASLDAAMTLAGDDVWLEIKGPRKYLNLPQSSPNYWSAYIDSWNHENGAMGWGATAAIAVCVAALKALRARKGHIEAQGETS